MRKHAQFLACLGLSSMVPAAAFAQAPAGYAPQASASMPAPAQGQVVAMPAPAHSHAAPHRHGKLRTLCAKCAKAEQASAMPPGKIVACSHSKNGVCATCASLLALPGPVTMGAPPAAPAPMAAEAPGRAVASSDGSPSAAMMAQRGAGASAAVYDPSMAGAEPTPIGVMQAGYSNGGNPAMGMNAGMGMPMPAQGQFPAAPMRSADPSGHAVADSTGGNSPAPFQHKTSSSRNPNVIGHLLGFSRIGSEWREDRANRRMEAHASIPYNNEGTTINEVPASMVYPRR